MSIAFVNDVPIADDAERLAPHELRQRACTELLRQAAISAGLLAATDPAPVDGIVSAAASQAIETLIERELRVPEPSPDECRRHHAAHAARYEIGERAHVRHVLFAVTPGVDVNALRRRAESCLLDLRCAADPGRFAEVAHTDSNCPSAAQGGDLGWITAADCAPEFAHEIFGRPEIGVLPRLLHSRFGLHVAEVLAREPGRAMPFATVHAAVAQTLRQHNFATALRQYLQLLAGQARIVGVDLEGADTPLVQ
jgi:peptidyl-prolyl cis-trans isomerase C